MGAMPSLGVLVQDPIVADQAPLWAYDSTVQQAVGVLVLGLRLSPTEAMVNLERAAIRHQTHLGNLARTIVDLASAQDIPPRRLQEIATAEWGDFFL